MGFRDSEAAHRGCQIQGTCESTNEGFGRSSPDCASGRGETPRRVDGRHAHRRTESEVVVGGQESGDARCSGCGRHRGNISVGAVDRQGCRSHARDLSVRKFRRRVSVSVSPWRGAVRTLLREVRTPRCIARYGHRRGSHTSWPNPPINGCTQTTEASNPDSIHGDLLDSLQEDLLLPGSMRRVRRRIRDTDSEDGVRRERFGRFTAFTEPTEPPRRRLVLVSSTQVDPVPPTVLDSVDSPSRRRRTVPHSEGSHRGEGGAIFHDLTLVDSSDDDAPFTVPGSAASPARSSRRLVLVPGSVDATPQSIQDVGQRKRGDTEHSSHSPRAAGKCCRTRERGNGRPQFQRRKLPPEVLEFEPQTPVELDRKTFFDSLRSSPRGSSGGPGGCTYEHLKLLLDDSDATDLFVAVCNRIAQNKSQRR